MRIQRVHRTLDGMKFDSSLRTLRRPNGGDPISMVAIDGDGLADPLGITVFRF
jgi:hypothetical protein